MSSFAKRFNKNTLRFTFNIPEDHEYCSLKDLFEGFDADKVYPLKAVYINNKGHFGKSPVLVTEYNLVNAPSHLTEICEQIMGDENAVNSINNGKVGFKVYEYTNKFGVAYSIEWEDIQ